MSGTQNIGKVKHEELGQQWSWSTTGALSGGPIEELGQPSVSVSHDNVSWLLDVS